MMSDYYGEALASQCDLNNRLGYTSNVAVSANTYNLTTNPGSPSRVRSRCPDLAATRHYVSDFSLVPATSAK